MRTSSAKARSSPRRARRTSSRSSSGRPSTTLITPAAARRFRAGVVQPLRAQDARRVRARVDVFAQDLAVTHGEDVDTVPFEPLAVVADRLRRPLADGELVGGVER